MIEEKLSKIATADIKTGLITGTQNEKERLHEQGHLEYQKTAFGSALEWLFQTSQMFMLGCLAISFFIEVFKYFSVGLFIFMLFCLIYEEYWVEEYAKKNEERNMGKEMQ
jgi:hypothetical protein